MAACDLSFMAIAATSPSPPATSWVSEEVRGTVRPSPVAAAVERAGTWRRSRRRGRVVGAAAQQTVSGSVVFDSGVLHDVCEFGNQHSLPHTSPKPPVLLRRALYGIRSCAPLENLLNKRPVVRPIQVAARQLPLGLSHHAKNRVGAGGWLLALMFAAHSGSPRKISRLSFLRRQRCHHFLQESPSLTAASCPNCSPG